MPSISRRNFFVAATGIAAAAAAPRMVFAQAAAPAATPATGPFTLPALTYAANALEPHIDARTMEIHHDKHHAAYVANMNTVAKTHPQLGSTPIETVLEKISTLSDDIKTTVRNNLGGHANHTMFWQIMGPNGGKPTGDVLAAIDKDLGGLEKFQTDFNAAGGRQFGSGWVFVTVDKSGKLAIETRPNQDSPIMDGKRVLMGNDVWEHAYYLNYQNRRPDYLKAWWNTVNWARISERYAAAKAGKLTI
jgi:Fe-Mn family superoxide dismutase